MLPLYETRINLFFFPILHEAIQKKLKSKVGFQSFHPGQPCKDTRKTVLFPLTAEIDLGLVQHSMAKCIVDFEVVKILCLTLFKNIDVTVVKLLISRSATILGFRLISTHSLRVLHATNHQHCFNTLRVLTIKWSEHPVRNEHVF